METVAGELFAVEEALYSAAILERMNRVGW
jgi:hypothetical protein